MTKQQEKLLEEIAHNLAELNATLRIMANSLPLNSNNGYTPTSESFPESSHQGTVIEEKVTNMLNKLCIPSHLSGYLYLKEALLYCMSCSKIPAFAKELYPTIAQKYQTIPDHIGRNIYHTIQVAWQYSNCEYRDNLFKNISYSKSRIPSVSVFISTVVNELKHS